MTSNSESHVLDCSRHEFLFIYRGELLRKAHTIIRLVLVSNIISLFLDAINSFSRFFCLRFSVFFSFQLFENCVCVRLHSENSEPTMFSQMTPDGHPPTPPPCRCPALITLPALAKSQLLWRRLCDVLFPSSCLVEHTLTAVCVLPEYQRGRKYNDHSYLL